jgi:PAS domain-containing protein
MPPILSMKLSQFQAPYLNITMLLDWTRCHDVQVSGYTRFLQKYDWESTALGSIQCWPTLLRQQICQIVAHPEPRILLWGPELAFLYNEAAIRVIKHRARHPESLGQPARKFWSEVTGARIGAMVTSVTNSGQARHIENFPVLLSIPWSLFFRCGSGRTFCKSHPRPVQMMFEESFFNFTMVPIFDEDGEVVAVLEEFAETTGLVIARRRMDTISRLEENTYKAHSMNCIWKRVLDALKPNPEDIPFALVYSVIDDAELPVYERLALEGAIGVPVKNSVPGMIINVPLLKPWIERAWSSGKPVIASMNDLENRFFHRESEFKRNSNPKHNTSVMDWSKSRGEHCTPRRNSVSLPISFEKPPKEGFINIDRNFIVPRRGHDTAITSAVIIPIRKISGPDPVGILVLATNPLRPYDDDYQNFIRQFTESVVHAVATMTIREEQRNQKQAAEEMRLHHSSVSAHLLQRAQMAERTEAKFRHLAEKAPVGMCLFGSDAEALWANNAYKRQFSLQESVSPTTWKTSLHPDDHKIVDANWRGLEQGVNVGSFELRVRQYDNLAPEDYVWLLCDATAQYDTIGKLESVTCWYR